MQYCEEALRLDPDFAWAHLQKAMTLLQLGEHDEAAERIRQNVDPRLPWGAQYLGYGYAISGREAEAREVISQLESLTQSGFASAANTALVYLGLKEESRALDHLELALEEKPAGSTALAYAGVLPVWDPLRNNERFRQVVARVEGGLVGAKGLPPREV